MEITISKPSLGHKFKKLNFPFIGESESGELVFFLKENKDVAGCFEGFNLSTKQYSKLWYKDMFIPFDGNVTLKNDL